MLLETPDASPEMADHVERLLCENGITANWSPPQLGVLNWFGSCGDLVAREISIGPITDEMSYFVALHEIGHIVLQMPTDVEMDGVSKVSLDNEVTVWAWAVGKALVEPS